MSYDIRIWSVNKPEYGDILKDKGFERINSSFIYSHNRWQIVIGDPCSIDQEDIPKEIIAVLPGIQYVTEFNVEGDYPQKAMQLLDSISINIAKKAFGIVVDEQEGTVRTAAGVKRFTSIPKDVDETYISMAWWFNDDTRLRQEGLRELIDLIELMIPEAMPRRYGLYEPPQYKYQETGKEHFVQYMYDNLDNGVVWYPHKPFDFISFHARDIGPTSIGYRFGDIAIDVYESVLKQPGWGLNLKRFWLKASDIINPFFGQITKGKGRAWACACWWTGIPRNLGAAIIIGHPYIELWPQFISKAQQTTDGLYYIENIEGQHDPIHIECDQRLLQPIKKPISLKYASLGLNATPEERHAFFAAHAEYNKKIYPEIWPFDGPFKKDEVLDTIEEAIKNNPDDPDLWFSKGMELVRLNRIGPAFGAFNKATAINPKHQDAWYQKAVINANNKRSALAYLKKSIKIKPEYKMKAKTDEAFKLLWDDSDFIKVVDHGVKNFI